MIDLDLVKILNEWPNLPPDIKAAVLTLIRQQGWTSDRIGGDG